TRPRPESRVSERAAWTRVTSKRVSLQDKRLLMPIVRQQHEAANIGIRDRLLVIEAEQNIVAATGTAADQSGTLPPGGERLIVKCRVIVLELKVDAGDLVAAARPRAGDVDAVVDNMGHGATLKSLTAVLDDATRHFLRRHGLGFCSGGPIHGNVPRWAA